MYRVIEMTYFTSNFLDKSENKVSICVFGTFVAESFPFELFFAADFDGNTGERIALVYLWLLPRLLPPLLILLVLVLLFWAVLDVFLALYIDADDDETDRRFSCDRNCSCDCGWTGSSGTNRPSPETNVVSTQCFGCAKRFWAFLCASLSLLPGVVRAWYIGSYAASLYRRIPRKLTIAPGWRSANAPNSSVERGHPSLVKTRFRFVQFKTFWATFPLAVNAPLLQSFGKRGKGLAKAWKSYAKHSSTGQKQSLVV